MATPAITITEIDVDGRSTLWDVMREMLRAKEERPTAPVVPTILVLKSQEIIAEIHQSAEEPRALIVRTVAGIRTISLNWYDAFLILYRTSVLTLQKMEGSVVLLFGERIEITGQATLYVMKWTARQFLQQPGRGAKFPDTNDSILQTFCLENEKVRWLSEFSAVPQFSF